ncbi:CD82 antigen-like [Mytilus galloprovincialis]|uniref:Tetraspanin n=1 Tax=Mytilus galloprovincialis TaxID=29158 RepID=A0A8B6D6E3_MYTGA|nr:Hypothetical predicted protein [Mytilus galloprovincialis]
MLSRQTLKIFMTITNVLFFIIAGVMLGIGIWIAVDKIFISDIIGTDLFNAGAYLMIICGAVLILISIWGCLSTVQMKRMYIMIYFVAVLVSFIMLIGAGIMAAAFQGEIKSTMLTSMRATLQTYYGADGTRADTITRSWDETQTLLRCCAVEDRDYRLYRESWYYKTQIEQGVQRGEIKYVPASCCVYTERYQQYVNLHTCQRATHMAPGSDTDRGNNPALYYTGCYQAAVNFVQGNAEVLVGMGFGFSVILICGMVFSILLYRRITYDFTPVSTRER